MTDCPDCNGEGERPWWRTVMTSEGLAKDYTMVRCERCRGTGDRKR